MKQIIIDEIDKRIKSIKKNQSVQRGGYYKVNSSGQIFALEQFRKFVLTIKES